MSCTIDYWNFSTSKTSSINSSLDFNIHDTDNSVGKLSKTFDNGNCAVEIFFHFQKALDPVDHCILLDKLHIYGIRGIAHDWFSSYMDKRHQSVMYNIFESDYKELKCGVSQGSLLGPLLFLININHLPSVSKLFMPIILLMIPIVSALTKSRWCR